MAANDHSGYPLKWFKDQDSARSSFECAVCLEVLKDPVQVRDCGHQFCGLCIDDILMSDPRCPSCRITISKTIIFQDHAANRLIRKLVVNCSNEDCSWLGNLSSYLEDHVNSCLFRNQAGSNNNLDAKKLEEKFANLDLEITALKQERKIEQNEMKKWKTKHENDVKQLKSKYENAVKQLKAKHQQDIKELKQQINQTLVMSNNSGTFTLKISDFENKLLKAKSVSNFGNKIQGEPFFSSHYGYKMKLLIYLDQRARGFTGYMGAYIILMRSDHDGMLPWPFKKSLIFSVIDQQDEEHCRMDHVTVLGPRGEVGFMRPQQDENQGFGFKEFISHSKLCTRKYIKDNTVYIQVHVRHGIF